MNRILAGNWKLHKTRPEVEAFFQSLGASLARSAHRKIVAPSPTLLETAIRCSVGTRIEVFAQNVSFEKSGAWTGEVSPAQLLELGVRGTLVGHSERRQYFGETDGSAARRAKVAAEQGLEVIFCIGESLEDRKAGSTLSVLERQLLPLIRELHEALLPKMILAYEPVWAIGTGLNASVEQIEQTHAQILSFLSGYKLRLPILYGGSVKPTNFKDISSISNVQGALVGGASLEAASFRELHDCL
jgi:triosephosphate isomerase